jgi:hypothetical protein
LKIKGIIEEKSFDKDGNFVEECIIENTVLDSVNKFMLNQFGNDDGFLNAVVNTGLITNTTDIDNQMLTSTTVTNCTNLFDGSNPTVATFPNLLSSFTIDFGYSATDTKTIVKYKMFMTTNFDSGLGGWNIYGSSTNEFQGEEILLDERIDILWTGSGWREYQFRKVGKFRYYKFVVTQFAPAKTLGYLYQFQFLGRKSNIARIGFGSDNTEINPGDYELTKLKSTFEEEQLYEVCSSRVSGTAGATPSTQYNNNGINFTTNGNMNESNAGFGAIFYDLGSTDGISVKPLDFNLLLECGVPRRFYKYRLMGGHPVFSLTPQDWTFEGSNNSVDWDILDTRTGETPSSITDYTISTPDYYRFYRVAISANHGNAYRTTINYFNVYEKTPIWGEGINDQTPHLQDADIEYIIPEKTLRFHYKWTNNTGSPVEIGETGLYEFNETNLNTTVGYPIGGYNLITRLIRASKTSVENGGYVTGTYSLIYDVN